MSKQPPPRPNPHARVRTGKGPDEHAPGSPSASSQFDASAGAENLVILKELALRQVQQRRARKRFFNEQLFVDLAWDILLALFIADADASDMSIADLTRAAGASEATTERWVAALKSEGLVEQARQSSRSDTVVTLTSRGHSAIVGALGCEGE